MLGSGTAPSRAPRTPAGHAVRVGDEHLLFDCGPATMLRMAEAGIGFEKLAHVFVTHFHPDHVSDLGALLFARNIPGVESSARLTLWGPEGIDRFHAGLRQQYGDWVDGRQYRLEVRRFPGEIRRRGWTVRSREVEHVPGALAYRIEAEGRSVVYSGDTGYCPAIVELCRGADLAVLECSLPDEDAVDTHLTPARCGRIAAEAGVGRLMLTHLYPACESIDLVAAAARGGFSGPIEVAEDLARAEP